MPLLGSIRPCTYPPCSPCPLPPLSLPHSWMHLSDPAPFSCLLWERVLLPRPSVSPLPPPTLSPPLLPMLSCPLPPWVCQACCLQGAGDWPLGGLRPGGRLTIWATMARVFSSDIHLPPNGGGVRSTCPLPFRRSLVVPLLPLRLAVGGLCRSGVNPPLPYPPAGLT